MLLKAIPLIYRRRGGRKGRAQAPSPPSPPPPPPPAALELVGIEDLFDGGDVLSFIAVFDTNAEQPLVDPAGASPAKWTARYNGSLFEGASLVLGDFQRISVGMTVVGAEAGANVLNYSNAPSDIADTEGRMLGAFSDFPLP